MVHEHALNFSVIGGVLVSLITIGTCDLMVSFEILHTLLHVVFSSVMMQY